MRGTLAAALALSLCVPAGAAGKEFKVIGLEELARALESPRPPALFDANVRSVREKVGLIPGARALSSSSKYDVAAELPKDKNAPLVFYCANTMCTASHDAARRALAAGYADVSVMPDGVFGWKKAGRPLSPLARGPRELRPSEVSKLAAEGGAVIVDVREDEERLELVPGARSLPMSRASDDGEWSRFAASLPRDKTIVFHCAAGKRAKRAAEKLAKSGHDTAYFEGPDQWKAAGLPVEPGPASR